MIKTFLVSFFEILLFVTVPYVVQSQTLQDSLVAHYPFNGDALDVSTNSNNGTNNSASLTEDRFGNPESAYLFNGNAWIQVPHDESINFSITEEYSISLWYQFSNNNTAGSIMEKWVNGFDNYPYAIRGSYTNGNIVAGRYTGGLPQDSSRAAGVLYSMEEQVIDERWHHLAIVFRPDSISIFFDGEFKASQQNYLRSGEVSNVDDLYIGRRGNRQDRFFSGKIDDIRIYRRGLNVRDVSELFGAYYCYETIVTQVFDTVYTNLYDTINIELFDTIAVYDTLYTQLFDSITVYDTLYTQLFDTVNIQIYDTLLTEVFDTVYTQIIDTTVVQVYDTLTITDYETIYVAVHDTLVINTNILGIGQEWNVDFLMYPNPAATQLIVDFRDRAILDENKLRIIIKDPTGKLLRVIRVRSTRELINIKQLNVKGLIFVQILNEDNNQSIIKKVVIK